MANIHPTAIVDKGANLADGVKIGPFCVVGADVVLEDSVELCSHVVVEGRTRIGARTRVFPFASVGHRPQDLKYRGEPSELVIGSDCVIREHATLNPGTEGGGMVTRVGNSCLLMVNAHIAHDCIIGDHVILVNNVMLGGHVVIGDFAIIGGGSGVHQFVRIGQHAMIGGLSGVEKDVIPFGTVMGDRARLSGLNLVGLKRRGFAREDIHDLRAAYRLLFAREGTMDERLADVRQMFPACRPVMEVADFISFDSSRSICQPLDGAAP